LHVCGGYTSDDKPFIKEQIKKFRDNGFKSSIKIYPEFIGNSKQDFLNSIDILSVPVRKYDAYGLYILESNAAGIPVLLPATGAFPEILEMTGGGVLYSPDSIDELVLNLKNLLPNKPKLKELGNRGKNAVNKKLSFETMSDGLKNVYETL
jgi:glycosyltransferase involved in cell wall biosynthesis